MQYMTNGGGKKLTVTVNTVSPKPDVAAAVEAAFRIVTRGILVTDAQRTFVDI